MVSSRVIAIKQKSLVGIFSDFGKFKLLSHVLNSELAIIDFDAFSRARLCSGISVD